MKSSPDEDWSIISSSDYEEDLASSLSVSRQNGGKNSTENYELDMASASVSTVRPLSQSGNLAGSRLLDSLGCSQGGAPGLGLRGAPGANGASDRGPGGAEPILAPAAPWSLRLAQVLAPYSAARRAAACGLQSLRESNANLKSRLRKMFHPSLARMRSRCERFSQPRLRSALLATVAVLEAQEHLLVYFAILAVVATCAGGVLGANLLASRHLYAGPARTWGSFRQSKSGSCEAGNSCVRVCLWVQRAFDLLATIGGQCSEKTRGALDWVLYEDIQEKQGWFGHNMRARKLRFGRLAVQMNTHLNVAWNSLQGLRTTQAIAEFRDMFSAQNFSRARGFVRARASALAASLDMEARLAQWRCGLGLFATQALHAYKTFSVKSWKHISSASQIGWDFGSRTLRTALESAKKRTQVENTEDLKKMFLRQSQVLRGSLVEKYERISAEALGLGASFLLMASKYQTRIDSVEKRARMFDSVKQASQGKVNLWTRRIQVAALEAFRLSRNMTELAS